MSPHHNPQHTSPVFHTYYMSRPSHTFILTIFYQEQMPCACWCVASHTPAGTATKYVSHKRRLKNSRYAATPVHISILKIFTDFNIFHSVILAMNDVYSLMMTQMCRNM
jgi:hypothetical protein